MSYSNHANGLHELLDGLVGVNVLGLADVDVFLADLCDTTGDEILVRHHHTPTNYGGGGAGVLDAGLEHLAYVEQARRLMFHLRGMDVVRTMNEAFTPVSKQQDQS